MSDFVKTPKAEQCFVNVRFPVELVNPKTGETFTYYVEGAIAAIDKEGDKPEISQRNNLLKKLHGRTFKASAKIWFGGAAVTRPPLEELEVVAEK